MWGFLGFSLKWALFGISPFAFMTRGKGCVGNAKGKSNIWNDCFTPMVSVPRRSCPFRSMFSLAAVALTTASYLRPQRGWVEEERVRDTRQSDAFVVAVPVSDLLVCPRRTFFEAKSNGKGLSPSEPIPTCSLMLNIGRANYLAQLSIRYKIGSFCYHRRFVLEPLA